MPELQVVITKPGEEQKVNVVWVDENQQLQTTEVLVELMNQDSPRLLGVKVERRPVFLRSSDIVFHSASALQIDEDEIAHEVAKRFRCFGGGQSSYCNPVTRWTENEPLSFAAMVPVADVIRFVLECAGVKTGA